MTYITGKTIKMLREKRHMTQKELAEQLCVSDKTISKWETDKGLPDIGILTELAEALRVSVPELLSGDVAINNNRCANIKRGRFHVCPICSNVVYSLGDASLSCCGVRLIPYDAEAEDETHEIETSIVDGELYVHVNHPMTKNHYISFIACLTDDTLQLRKLYPEQEAEAYFRRCGFSKLFIFCNRHGLYEKKMTRR